MLILKKVKPKQQHTLAFDLFAFIIDTPKLIIHCDLFFDVTRNIVQKQRHESVIRSFDDRIQFQIKLEVFILEIDRLAKGVDEVIVPLFGVSLKFVIGEKVGNLPSVADGVQLAEGRFVS